MDFAPTEQQQDLTELTRRIATGRVAAERPHEAESEHFDRALWADLAKAGVLAAALPDSLGGAGCGPLEQCSVLVELGRAVAPVPYLTSLVTAAGALARFGDEHQRERWARPAGTGELVLTAAFAEGAEHDPRPPATRADRTGDRWVLAGAKVAVPAGTVADAFLVPATTPDGTRVFVVAAADPGVSVRAQRVVDGDAEAVVELADVPLDEDRLLGGADVAGWLADRFALGTCAEQLGVLERALELTAAHARDRVQFDRPIGTFQAVSQRLADAYVDVEAVRLTTWQAACRAAQDLPCTAEVAVAKFWAAEAGHRVAHTAVHVHGGTGIDLDHQLHRYFTAAKRREFALGGATAQLHRIGAALAAEETDTSCDEDG
ncbi:acyl-CoA dehydrogenase family protein [Saccharopolyspora sp. NPDC047091]|uniref:acyl-CoA dehydrogenase family protein n=1 Tax=Saccharopolyspora sp. NPDC047091 TaxID=3155924 RepID=UPI0033FED25A